MDPQEREEILVEAAARILAVSNRAYEEVERIRAEVEALTGESVIPPWPRRSTGADQVWFDLVSTRAQCTWFTEAMESLRPLMEGAPDRTVGSVLKTMDRPAAARVSELLEQCRFFGSSSEG